VDPRDDSDRQHLTMTRLRPAAALSMAVVVAGAAIVVATVLRGAREPHAAPPPGPRVAANVALGDALGQSARSAFGSLWLTDSSQGVILRVDARTRRVTKRIPVGSEVALAIAAGSVWALPRGLGYQGGPLLRIGPNTGRTIVRISLQSAAGGPFRGGSIIVAGARVWVLGATGALAIDPARDHVVARIRLGGSYIVTDAFVHDGELWLTRGDRSITRFDARTGRRLGRVAWERNAFLVPFGKDLIAVSERSVARVDARTGHATWRRPLGTELHDAQVAGSRLFVVGGDGPAAARDRVWALDARSGRIAGAVTMPEFGPVGMVAVGRGVWLLTAGGRAVVVEP
jgi:hypothetical protein